MEREHINVAFELKAFDEEQGIFEGYAAVTSIEDDGKDIIEPGAFTKTIAEAGPAGKNRVQILALHQTKWLPIGKPLELREDAAGLFIKGKISETALGKDVKTLIKDKVLTELSIGYDTIKAEFDAQGRRHLKELRLWEVSPVTWGMNQEARISGYKAQGGEQMEFKIGEKAYSFDQLLTARQYEEMKWQLQYALNEANESALRDENLTAEQKMAMIDANLAQYHAAVLAIFKKLIVIKDSDSEVLAAANALKSRLQLEQKAGAKISKANRDRIAECIKTLNELLGTLPAEEPTDDEKAAAKTASEIKAVFREILDSRAKK